MWYYGARGANRVAPADDLLHDYLTSSNHVKAFIKANGLPDVVRVHRLFEDYKSAREFESRLLTRVRADLSPRWLNKHTGPGSYVTFGPHSQSTKDKISEKRMGFKFSEESRKKMSESRKRYLHTDDGLQFLEGLAIKKRGQPGTRLGHKNSDDHRTRMSLSIKRGFENGRVPHNKGVKCSDSERLRLANLRKGQPASDSAKARNSAAVKAWWAAGRPKGGIKAFR